MKRKTFIRTFGLSVLGAYSVALEACKKPIVDIVPSKSLEPNVSGQLGGGGTSLQINDSVVIEGYVDRLSFFQGETMKIYINGKTEKEASVGIYNSNGNLINHVSGKFGPQIARDESYKYGCQYRDFVEFTIPEELKSGLYYVANKIPFIVKNRNRSSEIVVVLSSNTDNAYNAHGGLSSYTVPVFSPVLSFQRPYQMKYFSVNFWPWAETLPYEIDYITDAELDEYNSFSYAKILIIPGHNEYWTRKARINFDRFVKEGNHALILSGNTMWWQIRYSDDGSQMFCYKGGVEPEKNVALKTTNWSESELKYPIEESIGVNFINGGYGDNPDDGWDGYKIVSENSPLLIGTELKNGDVLSCMSKEYDGAPVKFVAGNPHPVLDNKFKFHKIELIGYDYGFRDFKTVGTFIVMKKTSTSGTIVNTASTDWCAPRGMGGKDGAKIKRITINAIELLLNNRNVFSS